MTQSRRDRQREATYDEIKAIARQQMSAEGGAVAISLRAIAAKMGITAPAIYRYFGSRDDLITALIIDAYTAIGDAIIAASETPPEGDFAGRFFAAAMAYRDWALANPADFGLIYGTPIPGYSAPGEQTVALVARALAPFIIQLQGAWEAGQLQLPAAYAGASNMVKHHIEVWMRGTEYPLSVPVFHYAIARWAQMHGMVTLELNGQFHPMTTAAITDLYRFEIETMLKTLGMMANE